MGALSGYYEKGGLPNPWQVSNWEVGTTIIEGGAYCRAYARGNFHWGFEYQGNGVVIQDVYEDVRVSVTRDGTVYRSQRRRMSLRKIVLLVLLIIVLLLGVLILWNWVVIRR